MSPLLNNRITISPDVIDRLVVLAKHSLESLDVPIGAVIMYDNKIIGEGYNTVLRNHRAGEHAEINAISDALRNYSPEQFKQLDRTKLILISSFEPCLMCIGACLNNNIRIVYFLQPKEWREILQERKGFAAYFLKRRSVKNNGEQIDLFRLHPDFPAQKGYKKK